jgi:integrase
VVLTAARTSEALAARWEEIDLVGETWTVPPERTKTVRQHRAPLSRRCLEILADARQLSGDSPYVFPGRSVGKPLSNMALLMTLRRMGLKVTAHGFRSSFRDWASERTSFPREVCELALGHSVKDKTEAAYRRGDLLDKRRDLMEAWAAFATPMQAHVVALIRA